MTPTGHLRNRHQPRTRRGASCDIPCLRTVLAAPGRTRCWGFRGRRPTDSAVYLHDPVDTSPRHEHPPPWKEVVVIVVTGSTGTLGGPLIQHLVQRGEQVRAVVRNRVGRDLPTDVEVVQCALPRPDGLGDALRNVNALFVHPRAVGMAAPDLLHLAAEHA